MRRLLKLLKAILLARIYFPWSSGGGTLGLSIRCDHMRWYGDLFLGGKFGGGTTLRRFVNNGTTRHWSTLTWNGWEIDKEEVL